MASFLFVIQMLGEDTKELLKKKKKIKRKEYKKLF